MVLFISIYCVVGFACIIAGWILTYKDGKESIMEIINMINSNNIFLRIVLYVGSIIVLTAVAVTWPIWVIKGFIK